MIRRVRVYVEGGGDTRLQQRSLCKGFQQLFEAWLGDLPRPRVIACGGRTQAFDDFVDANRSHRDELSLLLVDSEAPVTEGVSPWDHVLQRIGDGWKRPVGVGDDQLYFMAQAMEAWLLADVDALNRYYGQRFRSQDIPVRRNVEELAKQDLFDALTKATREARSKGPYCKRHGCELIGEISPAKLRERSPVHAVRFFDRLREAMSGMKAQR